MFKKLCSSILYIQDVRGENIPGRRHPDAKIDG